MAAAVRMEGLEATVSMVTEARSHTVLTNTDVKGTGGGWKPGSLVPAVRAGGGGQEILWPCQHQCQCKSVGGQECGGGRCSDGGVSAMWGMWEC